MIRVGINANTQAWGPGTSAEQAKVKAATGVGWLREDFSWPDIEPVRGQFDFAQHDRVVLSAAKLGMRVLPVLGGVPAWAGGQWNEIPTDPGRFAYWAAMCAFRYGPGGTFWNKYPEFGMFACTHFEIWNEPYIPNFAHGGPDPAKYARLYAATAKQCRAVCPSARFLISADLSCTSDWQTYRPWVGPMFDAVPDLGRHINGISVHPYSAKHPSIYTPTACRWQFRRWEQIQAQFEARDCWAPLWITELGWSVWAEGPSETDQAAYFAWAWEAARKTRVVSAPIEAFFAFGWRDYGPNDRANKESWYGLVRRDGSYRPAVAALKRISTAVGS